MATVNQPPDTHKGARLVEEFAGADATECGEVEEGKLTRAFQRVDLGEKEEKKRRGGETGGQRRAKGKGVDTIASPEKGTTGSNDHYIEDDSHSHPAQVHHFVASSPAPPSLDPFRPSTPLLGSSVNALPPTW